MFSKFTGWLLIALMAIFAVTAAQAQETKYVSGSSSAALTFAPNPFGKVIVKSLFATTDKQGGVVKFYARSAKAVPNAVPTNAATVIAFANTAAMTNSDIVCYVHANGTLDQTTISSATSSNVTLTAGITVAGASGDALYKLTQAGQILVGLYGTGAGTNDVLNVAGDIFASPGDSPVYLVIDGTSSAVLQATVGN